MIKKSRKVKKIRVGEAQNVDEPEDWSRTPSSSLHNNNAQEGFFEFDEVAHTSVIVQNEQSRRLPNSDRNESNLVEEFKNNVVQNDVQVIDEDKMDIDSD